MPDLSDTLRKCRIGTAKKFTLLLLLYHTQANIKEMKQTHSLGYAGIHALKQKDRTGYLGLLIVTLFMLDD